MATRRKRGIKNTHLDLYDGGGWSKDEDVTAESLYRKSQPSYEFAGGFVVEEDPEPSTKRARSPSPFDPMVATSSELDNNNIASTSDVFGGIMSDNGLPICRDCDIEFPFSHFYDKFGFAVCDKCKSQDKDKYKLIARTTAKTKYLLKDEDFDKRQPKLKFVSMKNPHNPRWGDMKLYLEVQIQQRALEVYETMEKIEELKTQRVQKASVQQQKRRDKQLKELRRELNGPATMKSLSKSAHEHIYGPEALNKRTGEYEKRCTQCDHKVSYEKM